MFERTTHRHILEHMAAFYFCMRHYPTFTWHSFMIKPFFCFVLSDKKGEERLSDTKDREHGPDGDS